MLLILDLVTQHGRAWFKKDGKDGLRNLQWWVSVFSQQTDLDDWSFVTPRPNQSIRPIILERYKIERLGSGNPSVKAKEKYNLDEVKFYIKKIYLESSELRNVHKKLIEKYPYIHYQLCEISGNYSFRGDNDSNAKLAFLLGISIKEMQSKFYAIRKETLAAARKASPKCREAGYKSAANILKIRVSKVQKILYLMIKSIDENAISQYYVLCDNKPRFFDIYSPKYNSLIEMNGRIWHAFTAQSNKNEKLFNIVNHNITNDAFKKKQAILQGFNFWIFWDDESKDWEKQIKSNFGVESEVSYEEAKNQINKKE